MIFGCTDPFGGDNEVVLNQWMMKEQDRIEGISTMTDQYGGPNEDSTESVVVHEGPSATQWLVMPS